MSEEQCPLCPHPAHSETEPPPDALYWNPDNGCEVLEDLGYALFNCDCPGEPVPDEKIVPLFGKYLIN